MIRQRAPVALLLALATSLSLAQAQTRPTDGTSTKPGKRVTIREELAESVHRDWDTAVELFEGRDYVGALVQFQRVYDLSRNPRVLFNVGVCEKNLLRYSKAIAKWKQQLAEGEARLQPDEAQQARDAIAALQPFVTTVEVTTNQPGATLFIDEQEVGETPLLAPVPIDVGKRILKLRKQGFQERSRELTITSGTPEKVSFVLDPIVRKSIVSIRVAGPRVAHISVDGVDVGPAPFRGEISVGKHTFEARSPRFVTVRQTSNVSTNNPLDLALTMAPDRHTGKVRVTVNEQDATIEVDGKVMGTGTWQGVLPSGGHQLVVRKAGFQTYASDLALSDDQLRSVNVPLTKATHPVGWFWWTAGPAAIVIGGVIASYFIFRPGEQTPVTGTFDPGLVPTWHRGGIR